MVKKIIDDIFSDKKRSFTVYRDSETKSLFLTVRDSSCTPMLHYTIRLNEEEEKFLAETLVKEQARREDSIAKPLYTADAISSEITKLTDSVLASQKESLKVLESLGTRLDTMIDRLIPG